MKILIDGRIWSHFSAGIGTFFNCAILEWARQSSEDTFYVILPNGLDDKYGVTTLPKNIILLDYTKHFPKWLFYIIKLQLLAPYLCRKLHIDYYYTPVAHIPWFIPNYTKTIVTIHDVVNIEMAHTMAWKNRIVNIYFFGQAVKNADYLWTNSHYTKSKVKQYFTNRRCHQIFVGAAVDRSLYFCRHLSDEDAAAIRKKYNIQGRFILFVGSLEPRKNLTFLLQIIPELYREHSIQLVVVGGKGWKNSELKEIVESPDFPKESTIFCGFVSNDDLAKLYNTADCFVSAALMEGFGMPQLEALLCGCPVVTAHNTAMIEVAEGKDGAYTVEGYDPKKWIDTIVDVVKNHPKVNQEKLTEYDWELIIRKLNEWLRK